MPESGSTRSSRFSPNNRDSSITTPEFFPQGPCLSQIFQPCFWLFFSSSLHPSFPTPGFPFALSYSSQLPLLYLAGPNLCHWSAHLRSPVSPVLTSSSKLQCFLAPYSSPSFPPEPHRITAVERCLWRFSSPIPLCSKQSQLKQVAPQVPVSLFFPVSWDFRTGFLGILVLTFPSHWGDVFSAKHIPKALVPIPAMLQIVFFYGAQAMTQQRSCTVSLQSDCALELE